MQNIDFSRVYNMRNFSAPYVYQEYPRWVSLPDGSQILVNNAEEAAAATCSASTTADVPAEDESYGLMDRAQLVERAKALGLAPHPRTGVQKLVALIAAAEAAE